MLFYLLCMKIGFICLTYLNFYQFFFYLAKLIPISVGITALALSYHLYNGLRNLFTEFRFSVHHNKKISKDIWTGECFSFLS
uniref:Succinate dehydrogenase subunit 3 n=1 Tax=Euonymus alatus TaxID=4307 RepID=A0A872PMJ0_EUOAL|nr:succinate dehydrogenase subunit 3 [Euonymus alatus]QOX10173.1 succinate dehydrogenase subunit 3 [Euonymus alatus]